MFPVLSKEKVEVYKNINDRCGYNLSFQNVKSPHSIVRSGSLVSQNRKTITSESSFPVENHYKIVYSWLNKGLKGSAAQQKWPPLHSSKLKLAFCEVKWRPSVYGLLFFPQPCLFWTSQLQQETHLAGASERNSWKLNAMCPHEFLRAHSSYCVPNACDRNINRSADVLSWVPNLPARQRVVTCQHYEEQLTVTREYIFTYNGISHWQERNLELSENMIPTLSQWLVSHRRNVISTMCYWFLTAF